MKNDLFLHDITVNVSDHQKPKDNNMLEKGDKVETFDAVRQNLSFSRPHLKAEFFILAVLLKLHFQ